MSYTVDVTVINTKWNSDEHTGKYEVAYMYQYCVCDEGWWTQVELLVETSANYNQTAAKISGWTMHYTVIGCHQFSAASLQHKEQLYFTVLTSGWLTLTSIVPKVSLAYSGVGRGSPSDSWH